jgi:membrane protein DedA with SNARE-associated domain
MILPAATRILPWLTPLAALGFALIQVLAIVVHANLGETAMTLPINLVLLALSLFVLWGRWRKAPISPRA